MAGRYAALRALGEDLWEVRSSLSKGRIARVLFCLHAGFLIGLHGFIKKTEKLPGNDLNLARKRMKELKE
jgi:phage-related protein